MKSHNSLIDKTVFLSAGFADDQQNRRPLFTTDAVVAFARAIFNQRGHLVFGGHPTISPLILSVGQKYRSRFLTEERFIHIYQSKFFVNHIIPEVEEFEKSGIGIIHWTKAVDNDLQKSLVHMRECMLKEQQPDFALFMGGKDGITKEFDLFLEKYPNRKAYPIGSTGGAAELLFGSGEARRGELLRRIPEGLLKDLRESQAYPFLAAEVVKDWVEQGK